MTILELRQLLDDITYKPGFRIEISHASAHFLSLIHYMPVRDVNEPEKTIILQRIENIHIPLAICTPDDIIRQVRHAIAGMEHHESDEWFKIGGKHFIEPHPENL